MSQHETKSASSRKQQAYWRLQSSGRDLSIYGFDVAARTDFCVAGKAADSVDISKVAAAIAAPSAPLSRHEPDSVRPGELQHSSMPALGGAPLDAYRDVR